MLIKLFKKLTNKHPQNQIDLVLPRFTVKEEKDTFLCGKLKKAKKIPHQKNYVDTLCQLFDLAPINTGIASICGRGDDLNTEHNYWLRADPVQFYPDLANIYLLGNSHLHLSLSECESLKKDLAEFLAENDITLHVPHHRRWYFACKDEPEIKTHPIEDVVGKNISPYLPVGKKWRQLFTELQMFLHQHQVNRARAQHNQPVINGLWLWGEGKLPQLQVKNSATLQNIYTDEVFCRGLAVLSGKKVEVLPPQIPIEKNHLIIVSDQFNELALYEEPTIWLEKRDAFVESWLMPLLARKEKNFQQVRLFAGDGWMYVL